MQWSVTRKNNKKKSETQRSGAKWSKAPMGPPLHLHPHPTKKNKQETAVLAGLPLFAGAGARRDATLCRHSREDGDRYQAGRVWGPSQSETWGGKTRILFIYILFYFLFFCQSHWRDFLGLFWDRSAACIAAPASSRASDRQQTNWMIQATELGGRGSDWGRWHVKDCSWGDAALKSPR